jgi:hypothetical protein
VGTKNKKKMKNLQNSNHDLLMEEQIMKAFIRENTWLTRGSFMDFGWGNGYVVIPKGNMLHGKGRDEIHDLIPMLEANGGLTFAESVDHLKPWKEIPDGYDDGWVIGFDTAHSWDTLEKWSEDAVMLEAEKLKEQLEQFIKGNS